MALTTKDVSIAKPVWKRVLRFLRPHRPQFIIALCCMVVFGASEGALPFLIKYILDGVFTEQSRDLLTAIPFILIAFAIFRATFDFGQQYFMTLVGHRVVRDIRNVLNSHLLKMSPGYFVRKSSADILSRITSDVLLVRGLLTDSISSVLRDSIRILALLASAVYLDPVLALIALVVFPLAVYPVYRFGRKMRKLSKRGQDAIGVLSGMLHESILGNKVVKTFLREAYERERFERGNETLTDTFIRSEKVRALTNPVNEVLASVAISGVILYGGFSVIGGTRSQGEFIAFLTAVFLLYEPFKKLSRVHNSIQQGLSGAERIFEILDTQPIVQESLEPVHLGSSNTIEFSQVSFSYSDLATSGEADRALHEINLRIEEGESVALVGFSGAGKSTFVDLVPRFIDPDEGVITIGGVNIMNTALSELRGRIAMVDQHTFLFHDTIFRNIAYGKPGVSHQAVEDAARAAYALDFIEGLPKGFDSVVGESGMTLSGGERQRIAIARAILKEAPILILDEATASLDNRSEREVQAALEQLAKGKTSIVIAHRLSTVRNADRIVVLSGGKIVEVGTHEELLTRGEEYSRLYALQFADGPEHVQTAPVIIN